MLADNIIGLVGDRSLYNSNHVCVVIMSTGRLLGVGVGPGSVERS